MITIDCKLNSVEIRAIVKAMRVRRDLTQYGPQSKPLHRRAEKPPHAHDRSNYGMPKQKET
jgi:hypothetical protein